MRLELFKSLWGVVAADGGTKTLAAALSEAAGRGYVGVECSVRLARELDRRGEFRGLLRDMGLKGGWDPFLQPDAEAEGARPDPRAAHGMGVEAHVAALRGQVEAARGFGLEIPFFNSHTGHDAFPLGKVRDILGAVGELEEAEGVEVFHEVHRGRCTYSPWSLSQLLGVDSSLAHVKLIADYSHFTCVTEADPWDDSLEEAVALLRPHVRHVHARVGYDNGPQAPDPRTPEWAEHTRHFEKWWGDVWSEQAARGVEVTYLTPEHGPPPYQHVHPRSLKPTADIEGVNDWLAQRQANSFRALGWGECAAYPHEKGKKRRQIGKAGHWESAPPPV